MTIHEFFIYDFLKYVFIFFSFFLKINILRNGSLCGYFIGPAEYAVDEVRIMRGIATGGGV